MRDSSGLSSRGGKVSAFHRANNGPRCGNLWLRIVWVLAASVTLVLASSDESSPQNHIDPAAWGDDHVGKPFPVYMTGDECLFCHRTIGTNWGENRHQLTIRPTQSDEPAIRTLRELAKESKAADETTYIMGSQRIARFLRRSTEYGKLHLLTTAFIPSNEIRGDATEITFPKVGELKNSDSPTWDSRTFADRCAGCHTTAVQTTKRAFSALSLDCFTCHGDVDLNHTQDVSLVLLSSKNRQPRETISICGQCHLRGGTSRSSGLPYPNTFVAGDNLFRDFEVDFSDTAIQTLPQIDQHIYLSARDVAVFGQPTMNCSSCHDIHRQSTVKHQALDHTAICSSCHAPGPDHTQLLDAILRVNKQKNHSRVCDY